MQPLTLWSHWGAPNPWKVRIVLDELKIPYTVHEIELSEVKSEEHVKLNPNGRLPTIQDPNTGIILWESGAIILYLVEQYDNDGSLTYVDGNNKHLVQQWLAFQVSGQGPYFGQATWFVRFHPEQVPSAIERYVKEMERVIGVIDDGLQRNETGWLVGDKVTIADLSFVTWTVIGEGLLAQIGTLSTVAHRFPAYSAWLAKLKARPAVAAALEQIAKGRQAHGLP